MRSTLKRWAVLLVALLSIGGATDALGAFVPTAQGGTTYLCISLFGQRQWVTGGIANKLVKDGWTCTHR